MEESKKMVSVILDKKIERYNYRDENFLAENELTVTITLDEYRELVTQKAIAKHEIQKAEEDKYKRNAENEALRKEIETLRVRIYELQNPELHNLAVDEKATKERDMG